MVTLKNQVKSEMQGDVLTFRIFGEFKLMPKCEKQLVKPLEIEALDYCRQQQGHTIKIILDLSKTSFIDSTALGTFLSIYRAIKSQGSGDMILTEVQEKVQSLLDITRMNNIFSVMSEAEALEYFQKLEGK